MSDSRNQLFEPPWWLRNAHIQSCLRSVLKPRSYTHVDWEELALPDGDFVDLCWAGSEDKPIVVLLHGLEGSLQSHYIQYMLPELVQAGFRVVLMHFRGCSGRLNRLPSSYHASHTIDFEFLLQVLRDRYPALPILAIGFSLGGMILVHHLAKNEQSPLCSAVVVSIPFEMAKSAENMPSIYKWTLLRTMKAKSIHKIQVGQPMPASIEEIKQVRSFQEFDNLLTAPLNNFHDAQDYYTKSSVRPILRKVKTAMLVINAEDDPLIPVDSIPAQDELSSSIEFELYPWGGHVGFLQGRYPWSLEPWTCNRILDFLQKSV